MEIHHQHHHDHPQHKEKVWKHYALEFFMLFLAVTAGFFVENLREDISDHHKEKEYMQSLVNDLRMDTVVLNQGFPLKLKRLKAIDSVYSYFETRPNATAVSGICYRNMRRTNWDRHYRRNSGTIDQLKNAGGLRLVSKTNIRDSISSYDLQWERAEYWRDACINDQREELTLIDKMVNATDLIPSYLKNKNGFASATVPDSSVVKINSEYLNEFLNFLGRQKIRTYQDSAFYKNIELKAERLSALINKEYHLE